MFDLDVLYAIPLAYYRWVSRRSQRPQPRIPIPGVWNVLLHLVYCPIVAALTALSILILLTGTSVAVQTAAAVVLFSCILHITSLFALDVNGRNGSDTRRQLLFIPVLMGPFVTLPVLSLVCTTLSYYGIEQVSDQVLLTMGGFIVLNLLNVGAHRRWALYKLGLER